MSTAGGVGCRGMAPKYFFTFSSVVAGSTSPTMETMALFGA
jgi:hypothetical protein